MNLGSRKEAKLALTGAGHRAPRSRGRRGPALVAALALAVALSATFAASAGAVQITEFPLPTGSKPVEITSGPDGNMWFTDPGTNTIGKITMSGEATEYGLGITPKADLRGIAAGPEGNLWFTERAGHKIGRITQSGAITEFSAGLTGSPDLYGITQGPGGAMWFTERSASSRIGEIDPLTGIIKEFPAFAGEVLRIVQGPDGNLWYTSPDKATISRMTPTGTVSTFGPLPASDCATGASSPCPYPESVAVGADGNLWFDEARGNAIGRITTSGGISGYSNGLTHGAFVANLAGGPEGNIWFTEYTANQIGRITPSGVVTEFSSGISEKATPWGIALGPDQNLWVAEYGLGKIARVIPDVAPAVTTGRPLKISSKKAVVAGTVRSRGADTHYAFEYGTTTAYGKRTPAVDNGDGDGVMPVSAQLRGLAPHRRYHYQLVAGNASGNSFGADQSFKTGPRNGHGSSKVTVGPFEIYFAGSASGRKLRLKQIIIIRAQRGERVSYRCARCHGSPSHRKMRATKSKVIFGGLKLTVDSHSLLRVTVTGKNGSKRIRTYGFRIAHAATKFEQQHCFAAGRHKAVPCPSQGSKGNHGKKGHHKRAPRRGL